MIDPAPITDDPLSLVIDGHAITEARARVELLILYIVGSLVIHHNY